MLINKKKINTSKYPESKHLEQVRQILDQIHADYNKKKLINPDPLQFLHDYPDIMDREIVALIGALLAYGRVNQILKAVTWVLETMHGTPRTYLIQNSSCDILHDFANFKYRFTKGEHIANLLMGIKNIISEYGSLKHFFLSSISPDDLRTNDILPAMTRFIRKLKIKGDTGNLAADPAKGSACKRNNLFLRWMVRHDAVDPGGWEEIPPAMLIIPLDTHMHHAGTILGFTLRKQANMKTAIEITEGFRQICPEDPVKYDFSLTRFGIRPDMSVKNLETLIWKH